MEAEIAKRVISNLRNPLDAKVRIHFTSRSILFIIKLFESKRIDTIELHYILLQIAYVSGCFSNATPKYINLKDLVVYLYSHHPPCITLDDIKNTCDIFTIDNDSDYKEVEDMKIIIENVSI